MNKKIINFISLVVAITLITVTITPIALNKNKTVHAVCPSCVAHPDISVEEFSTLPEKEQARIIEIIMSSTRVETFLLEHNYEMNDIDFTQGLIFDKNTEGELVVPSARNWERVFSFSLTDEFISERERYSLYVRMPQFTIEELALGIDEAITDGIYSSLIFEDGSDLSRVYSMGSYADDPLSAEGVMVGAAFAPIGDGCMINCLGNCLFFPLSGYLWVSLISSCMTCLNQGNEYDDCPACKTMGFWLYTCLLGCLVNCTGGGQGSAAAGAQSISMASTMDYYLSDITAGTFYNDITGETIWSYD